MDRVRRYGPTRHGRPVVRPVGVAGNYGEAPARKGRSHMEKASCSPAQGRMRNLHYSYTPARGS